MGTGPGRARRCAFDRKTFASQHHERTCQRPAHTIGRRCCDNGLVERFQRAKPDRPLVADLARSRGRGAGSPLPQAIGTVRHRIELGRGWSRCSAIPPPHPRQARSWRRRAAAGARAARAGVRRAPRPPGSAGAYARERGQSVDRGWRDRRRTRRRGGKGGDEPCLGHAEQGTQISNGCCRGRGEGSLVPDGTTEVPAEVVACGPVPSPPDRSARCRAPCGTARSQPGRRVCGRGCGGLLQPWPRPRAGDSAPPARPPGLRSRAFRHAASARRRSAPNRPASFFTARRCGGTGPQAVIDCHREKLRPLLPGGGQREQAQAAPSDPDRRKRQAQARMRESESANSAFASAGRERELPRQQWTRFCSRSTPCFTATTFRYICARLHRTRRRRLPSRQRRRAIGQGAVARRVPSPWSRIWSRR